MKLLLAGIIILSLLNNNWKNLKIKRLEKTLEYERVMDPTYSELLQALETIRILEKTLEECDSE